MDKPHSKGVKAFLPRGVMQVTWHCIGTDRSWTGRVINEGDNNIIYYNITETSIIHVTIIKHDNWKWCGYGNGGRPRWCEKSTTYKQYVLVGTANELIFGINTYLRADLVHEINALACYTLYYFAKEHRTWCWRIWVFILTLLTCCVYVLGQIDSFLWFSLYSPIKLTPWI